MNKTQLIDHIANETGLSKAAATRALDAAIDGISRTLERNENVALIGFGSFSVKQRAAREGRNPKTGDAVHIPARTVIKFSPGKKLKDAVN